MKLFQVECTDETTILLVGITFENCSRLGEAKGAMELASSFSVKPGHRVRLMVISAETDEALIASVRKVSLSLGAEPHEVTS